MLASSGPLPRGVGEYAYEPKYDGWRAVVYLGPEGLVVRTRSGRDVTEALPELAGLVEAAAPHHLVLDGELIAGAGRPVDFAALAGRMSCGPGGRAGRAPVSFVAFDVVWADGTDLCPRPYAERRARLEALELVGEAWCTTPSYVGHGPEVFAACMDQGLEGMVAKRLVSRYRPGKRSPDWVKAKTREWLVDHAPHRQP